MKKIIYIIILIFLLSGCQKKNIPEKQNIAEQFYWNNKTFLHNLSNDTTRKYNLFFSIENDSIISLELFSDLENDKYNYEINAKNYKQSESIKIIDSISKKHNINLDSIYSFFYNNNEIYSFLVNNKNTRVEILKIKFDIDYEIILTTEKIDYKSTKEDISIEIDSNVYFYYNSRPRGWLIPLPRKELIK